MKRPVLLAAALALCTLVSTAARAELPPPGGASLAAPARPLAPDSDPASEEARRLAAAGLVRVVPEGNSTRTVLLVFGGIASVAGIVGPILMNSQRDLGLGLTLAGTTGGALLLTLGFMMDANTGHTVTRSAAALPGGGATPRAEPAPASSLARGPGQTEVRVAPMLVQRGAGLQLGVRF